VKYYQELKQEYNNFLTGLEYIQKNNIKGEDFKSINYLPIQT
jgi:hypothetical protein